MRPADGVDDGGDFFHVAAYAHGGEGVGGLYELIFGDAGDALDHFRGVARVVFLQKLEDAIWVL